MILKWGICCLGKINQDFTNAFFEFKNSNNEITAVAASNITKAKDFAEKFNIKHWFGSYEDLAKFSDVDIVRIGSLHHDHCKLTKLFLNHGKHVLIDTPMGMNAKETKEMIQLAREKKLFLKEGMISFCLPIYRHLQEICNNKIIGTVRHINANFQIDASFVDRLFDEQRSGGGLLEFGNYLMFIPISIFKGRKLLDAKCIMKIKNGVDVCGIIQMEFEDQGTAFLTYHIGVNGDTGGAIYGDSGKIEIPDNWLVPSELIINGKRETMKLERKDESLNYNFPYMWNFIYEINHVHECFEKGLLESFLYPLDTSLQMAEITDTFMSTNLHHSS